MARSFHCSILAAGLPVTVPTSLAGEPATMVRDGILLHTGAWPGWAPPQTMPNSLGCIHAWPEDIRAISDALVARGVAVRNNTNGSLPYPYKPQGLLSVECPSCRPAY